MKRGELWIGASHTDYGGKPRPVLIVQSNEVRDFLSIIACPLTSLVTAAQTLRLSLPANERTGLQQPSWVMIDKTNAYVQAKLSKKIGYLSAAEMELVDAALLDLLGLQR